MLKSEGYTVQHDLGCSRELVTWNDASFYTSLLHTDYTVSVRSIDTRVMLLVPGSNHLC